MHKRRENERYMSKIFYKNTKISKTNQVKSTTFNSKLPTLNSQLSTNT